ncbi:hypothetical protein DFH07DRAFT_962319 [Mycena maculata]|uniref:Uncharacterized protein n=1 Tax=Mycena maculata TaxID=230809 RepID=A0AAD7IPT5_9AGAR|nr:hypothetical protein DFH07DRAFT_962319 [Mycena maculata]
MTQTTEEQFAAAAKETADLKASLATMTAMLTSLHGEIAKRPAANPLEQLMGLPADPLAFLPGANGAYPVLISTFLRPHLLPDVIAQIGKFEFPHTHLGRLLKSASAPPPEGLLLVSGPNGEARFVAPTPVAGTSVLLRECLMLPIVQALSAHLSNIITYSRVYSWPTVLDYHVAFMQARALDPFFSPINWTRSEPHLQTLHLLTPSMLATVSTMAVAVPAGPSSASPSSAGPWPTGPSSVECARMAAQICYNYNVAEPCPTPASLGAPSPEWLTAHSDLHPTVVELLWYGLRESTRSKYDGHVEMFCRFAREQGFTRANGSVLPADGPAVQLFIATKASIVQPATLSQYLTSLCTIHMEHGWSVEALNSPILKRLVAAAERRHGTKAWKAHRAITREILTDIFAQLPDDHDGRMLKPAKLTPGGEVPVFSLGLHPGLPLALSHITEHTTNFTHPRRLLHRYLSLPPVIYRAIAVV